MPLRAILFDFDGVIADTESLHLKLFQEVLKSEGVNLTKEDYYNKYLGLDDKTCFRVVIQDAGKEVSEERLMDLVERKHAVVSQELAQGGFVLEGVKELLQSIKDKYYTAIVSGALRSEIEEVLNLAGLRSYFKLIVGAEDVKRGKPDPEGYRMAMRLLNRDHVQPSEMLLPQECLVIEDSPWGLEAGKKAGCVCLAVENSYSRDRLKPADHIIPNLAHMDWKTVLSLFNP